MHIPYPSRLALMLVFGLLCGARAVAASDKPMVIVAEGRSDYVIAVADKNVDEAKINQAAELLQSLIAQATGVTLAMVKESEMPADAPAIYLGRTDAARAAGIPVDDIKGWNCHIRVIGRDVFLIGQDIPGLKGHVFSGHSGTFKAVTLFAERVIGTRFVLPGFKGIHVPKCEQVTVDAALNLSWYSPLRFYIGRRVVAYSAKHEYDAYAIANNYFGRYANDSETVWSGGTHTWGDFVPREKYIKTHPEYFGLFKGKRDPLKRNILCLSQPAVKDLLVQGVMEKFNEGYEIVWLGQADGYVECQCDACQAIHPDIGEKLWIYHRELAEKLYKLKPDGQVVLQSYVTTTKPPLTFDAFAPNVVISNNRYTPEYFEAWEKFDTPRVVFIPEWLREWPRMSPRYAVNLVRLCLENNVIGIYLGGGLDSGNSPWGLNGPSYYAFGKAMGNPSRDADDLEHEYVEASFGEAAAPMLGFFQTMHRRLEVYELMTRRETGNPDRRYRGYPFEMYPSDYPGHYFSPDVLNNMSRFLEQAMATVKDEDARARIELVDAEFRYLRAAATTYHVFRAYQAAPSWPMFDILEQQVASYRQSLDWLYLDGEARYPGGYRQLRTPFNTGWPASQRMEPIDDQPFNWNFDAIRAAKVLPQPILRPRIRGGEGLKPYSGQRQYSELQTAPAHEGADIDPRTGALYDQ